MLTLLTIAGAAVGFYLIMNKLTKGGGLFGGIGRKFQQEQHPSTNGWYKRDGIGLDNISKEHLRVLIIKDKEFKVGSLFQGW